MKIRYNARFFSLLSISFFYLLLYDRFFFLLFFVYSSHLISAPLTLIVSSPSFQLPSLPLSYPHTYTYTHANSLCSFSLAFCMGTSASKGGMSFNKKETDDIKAALASPYAEAITRILVLKKVFPENRMA